MHLVTAAEMRRFDARATEEYGIPSLILMENAGIQVGREVSRRLPGGIQGKQVLILCGKGNNGGDGLVVARHFLNGGAVVKVFLLAQKRELKGDALTNLTIYQRMGGKIYALTDSKDLNALRVALLSTDVVVDAIYGTGFKGAVSELTAKAMAMINATGLLTVAVDLPSGLEADTGGLAKAYIEATVTVTLGLPKIGLVLEPGASATGELVVADITLPQIMLAKSPGLFTLLTPELGQQWLGSRSPTAHKGTFGHLLVAGGNTGMAGAVVLCVAGALRAGAGLVTAAVPTAVYPLVVPQVPEAMTFSLPGGEGLDSLSLQGLDLDRFAALVIGPGMGRHPGAKDFLQICLESSRSAVVLDADALFALSSDPKLLNLARGPVILTPHPGEMARLAGLKTAEVVADRAGVALRYAREWGCFLVLKGARTLIATPDGHLYINPTGNPGMATGGSGDVLAGIIGSLLAQGRDAGEAAALGVYIHGLAGDIAGEQLGQTALKAGDIITWLPEAWKRLEVSA
ncbi:MAG: NAD(P)H-hydrate dehydratase [Heliobacteriaceae bacterium]|nr:NAD(P)H-hydrate dehydratase [Heliobacteriaceae bacterium]